MGVIYDPNEALLERTIDSIYEEQVEPLQAEVHGLRSRVADLESAIRGELRTLETSTSWARAAGTRLRDALEGKTSSSP